MPAFFSQSDSQMLEKEVIGSSLGNLTSSRGKIYYCWGFPNEIDQADHPIVLPTVEKPTHVSKAL